MDITSVKQTIQKLKSTKQELEDKKRELQFAIDKATEELEELEPKILETFGTTDTAELEQKLKELESEAQEIISEFESAELE